MNFEPTLTQGIIFSDMVIREQGTGKSTLVGTFGCYNLPQFPVQIPPFYATVLVANLTPDVSTLDVAARVENPQNGMVLASTAVKVQFGKPPTRKDVSDVSIPVFNLAFPAPGVYKVVILINNEKIGERDLPVNDIRATIQPTPPL
jgi:hypothetical protein